MGMSHLVNLLSALSPMGKRWLMAVGDSVALAVMVTAATSLAFGDVAWGRAILAVLIAIVIALPIFAWCGLYRAIIRYISDHALWAITKAVTVASVLWGLAVREIFTDHGAQQLAVAVILFWTFALVGVGGSRFIARWVLWWPLRRQFGGRQVLIFGANDAGWQLVSALRQGKEFFPAAFLDEDPLVIGKEIGGVRVFGMDSLGMLVSRYEIRDAIVALPQASELQRKRVVETLQRFNLRVRVMPPVADFTAGRYLPRIVREVDVGDLLGRDGVVPDMELMRESVSGRVVMVTGAGGSIGSELCRQIALLDPVRLVLVEINEYALYRVQQALLELGFSDLVPALGSIEDRDWLRDLIQRHGITTIFHAAAYKHVPLVEQNALQGIRNNVLGSKALVEAALAEGIERFVLISSDKAVHPTNVMGATKRWSELLVLAAAHRCLQERLPCRFSMVRFGNVLGSSGSVVPLFKRQIERGGPITVTHPEVTRYFMSIHEAVELVLQASSLAEGGEVFLLDMGEPVSILDLARKLITLAGLSLRDAAHPDGDIEIVFTGLRPGEKLHEELVIGANVQPTRHPKIRRADEPWIDADRLHAWVRLLEQAIARRDEALAREITLVVAQQPDGEELDRLFSEFAHRLGMKGTVVSLARPTVGQRRVALG